MQDIHPMQAVMSITFFCVPGVKCSSCEINKNNGENFAMWTLNSRPRN